jgi:hypothetical protein
MTPGVKIIVPVELGRLDQVTTNVMNEICLRSRWCGDDNHVISICGSVMSAY